MNKEKLTAIYKGESMPRRLIEFLPGGYYHLYNRGVNRAKIFFDKRDYHYFLFKIERYLMPTLDIIAYCLMPNHYHLIIFIRETSEVSGTSEVSTTSGVSRAMMRLSVSYTKTINLKYDRVGPLFQGAFQAKQVHSDAYLGQLIDYLHLNPVRSGLVEAPGDWPYSSFRLLVDLRGHDNLGGPRPLPRI
jgi:putative transposase